MPLGEKVVGICDCKSLLRLGVLYHGCLDSGYPYLKKKKSLSSIIIEKLITFLFSTKWRLES